MKRDTDKIIKILSAHRQSCSLQRPHPLTLRTIARSIEHNSSPNNATSDWVRECLEELQAEGEVIAGAGNQFCMAPPVVVAKSEDDLTTLWFRGDRAYLQLAHQALATEQSWTTTILRPRINLTYYRMKERLKNYGIKLLTVKETVEHLPIPEKPKLYLLSGSEQREDLLSTLTTPKQYVPQEWKQQNQRWQCLEKNKLQHFPLLRLSSGEYLWFESQRYFELSPNIAILAMFWLDQQARLPLRVSWDEAPGRLNLQGISLPSFYAQWLWQLSQPDPKQPRVRLFLQSKHEIVRQVFIRLGCLLV